MSSSRGQNPKKRSRGRPPTYVFPDDEVLTESMERLKQNIERRRKTQKDKYYRKKLERKKQTKKGQSSSNRNPNEDPSIFDGGLILDMAIASAFNNQENFARPPVYPRK